MTPQDRILVALDTADAEGAAALARRLAGRVGGVKLGKEFFSAQGPAGVERVNASGLPVFLDLKFHDIPNTVAGAVRAVLRLRPFMINVHAAGGPAMMQAAVAAAAGAVDQRPLVLAVTVLTSLDDGDLMRIGVGGTVMEQVVRLARLARDCGLDGVVCSAQEAAELRREFGPGFTLVVPGIRPAWASADDQKRIVTAEDAVALGADYLVIGRPITAASDPLAAVHRLVADLREGTSS